MDMHGKLEYSPCFQIYNSSNIMCSNFEMMPQKTHSLPQDLATPLIGTHRSRGFSHPVANPSFLVCSPSLAERGERPSPFAGSPFLWPGLGSFFGCFVGRPSVTSRGVVWRRCNRPRVRPLAADCLIKLLGAVYTANHPALLTNQTGRVTERD